MGFIFLTSVRIKSQHETLIVYCYNHMYNIYIVQTNRSHSRPRNKTKLKSTIWFWEWFPYMPHMFQQTPRCLNDEYMMILYTLGLLFRSLCQWANINLTIRNKTPPKANSGTQTKKKTIHISLWLDTTRSADAKLIYEYFHSKFKDKGNLMGVVYCANIMATCHLDWPPNGRD